MCTRSSMCNNETISVGYCIFVEAKHHSSNLSYSRPLPFQQNTKYYVLRCLELWRLISHKKDLRKRTLFEMTWSLPLICLPPPQTNRCTPLSLRNIQFSQTCAPHPRIDSEVVFVVLMVAPLLFFTALRFTEIASAHHG